MHSDMSGDDRPGAREAEVGMKWPESFRGTEGRSICGNAFFQNDGGGKFQRGLRRPASRTTGRGAPASAT